MQLSSPTGTREEGRGMPGIKHSNTEYQNAFLGIWKLIKAYF
jgi:hypothetical protein